MGASPFFPLYIVFFLASILVLNETVIAHTPAAQLIEMAAPKNEAEAFMAYKSAVHQFMEKNPNFADASVPFSSIAVEPYRAPTSMQSIADNRIIAVSPTRKRIVVYAALNPKVSQFVIAEQGGDASLGTATAANTWKSFNLNTPEVPLNTTQVPQGAIVSVIETGI